MGKHENLEKKMCRELEMLESKYSDTAELSIEDLKKIDTLAHALKSLATYNAMKEAEEGEGMDGYSGRRGRNAYNGRYMSRSMGPQSYDDGYSGRYPYPMWPPNERGW